MKSEPNSVRWYLSKITAFAALPAAELRSLCDAAELRQLPRGSRLYVPGDVAKHVYCIHGGRITALRESTVCRTINLGDFGPGEIVGESCLWTSEPREDTAVAESTTLLSVVPRAALLGVLMRHPAAERALFAQSIAHHRATIRRVCDAHTLGIRARLAGQLLRLAEHGRDTRYGRELAYPVRQRELAALVVSTRETVALELRRFERDRLIVRHGRQIFLILKALPRLIAAARDDPPLRRAAPHTHSSLRTSIQGASPL